VYGVPRASVQCYGAVQQTSEFKLPRPHARVARSAYSVFSHAYQIQVHGWASGAVSGEAPIVSDWGRARVGTSDHVTSFRLPALTRPTHRRLPLTLVLNSSSPTPVATLLHDRRINHSGRDALPRRSNLTAIDPRIAKPHWPMSQSPAASKNLLLHVVLWTSHTAPCKSGFCLDPTTV